jgi:hypothetical protein
MIREFDTIGEAVRVVGRTRWILLMVWTLFICSVCLNVVQYSKGTELSDRVNQLEVYISDNALPTPAWPPIDIDIRWRDE